jgi:hypothetical protein
MILTENGAALFTALSMYLIVKYFVSRKIHYLSVAVFTGLVSGLWRYSQILYGLLPLAVLLASRNKKIRDGILPVIGVALICGWIFINYRITGVWGMSDANGIHLWNMIVYEGRTLPAENTPSLMRLRNDIPEVTNLKVGYWDIQWLIASRHGMDWLYVDRLLGDVAGDAVKQHPDSYLITTISAFWQLHMTGSPYWENTGSFGRPDAYPYPPSCNPLGPFRLCRPIIDLPDKFGVWNGFVAVSDWYYRYINPVLMIAVLFPSLIGLLIWGNRSERWVVLLHITGLLSVAAYEHPGPRYVLPFYPLIAAVMFLGVIRLGNFLATVINKRREENP